MTLRPAATVEVINLIIIVSKAAKLQPATYQKLRTADHETAQAKSGLLTLADVDRRDSRFTPEHLEALTAAAPDRIGP